MDFRGKERSAGINPRRAEIFTAGTAWEAAPAPSRPAPARGIVAGTRVATVGGWRTIEDLQPGDPVMTVDNGPQRLVDVRRRALWSGPDPCPDELCPLAVPPAALGNRTPLLLLPESLVLVESDLAEESYGAPFVLVPAAALDGWRGIEPIAPHRRVETVSLHCTGDEIIYANGVGLIHCPAREAPGTAADRFATLSRTPAGYTVLPLDMARILVACLMAEDARNGDAVA